MVLSLGALLDWQTHDRFLHVIFLNFDEFIKMYRTNNYKR